ncbi:MAG: protein translocase subunit SecD [Rhodospirillaceae bacterium]
MLFFARWKVYTIIGVCLVGLILTLPNFFSRDLMNGLPAWLPHRQIHLGLDLRGGSYLLLEVDMPAVVKERLNTLQDGVRSQFRTANIGYVNLTSDDHSVTFSLRDPKDREEALKDLKTLSNSVGGVGMGAGVNELQIEIGADGTGVITLAEAALHEKAARAVEQSIEIIRRRIDETGVNEPTIARQGENRILVQLPGVDDPDRIKRLLGQTAKLTFRLLGSDQEAASGRVPPGFELLPSAEADRRSAAPARYLVRKRIEVDGANLVDARSNLNSQTSEWVVSFTFDSLGTRRFGEVSKANVGRPFAIVLDNKVISAPVIREPILGGQGQISGHFTAQSANDLAVLLRAGALPAPLTVIEERSVGPDLGADAIRSGIYSILAGFFLVVAYMAAAYGLFGLIANVALLFNLILTLGVLSLLQATLTLPGLAGILLTLGMSVDANILINERIREETRKGKSPFAAMEAGFRRAFSTIVDANLTTLIKMLLLFALGSGAVKGFAVTISFGILTSMFTATVLARLMMVSWLRWKRPQALPV